MTQYTQPTEMIIFVTHVEAEDSYLKIWGQVDKHAATCVERFIFPLVDQFTQGYGCPSRSSRLAIDALCCARFQTDGYYRAKILNVRPDGMIMVQFIDYGNVEILPPSEIHLLENIPGSEPLHTYPPMAAEFILVNVLPVNGVWENRTVEMIRKTLCYNEYRAVIHPTMNNRCLIKLWYNNEDFSELLVRECMALPINSQDTSRSKQLLQPQIQPVYQPPNKSNLNNFTNMPIMQNANINQNMNQNTAMQGMFHKTSPSIAQQKHVSPQPPPVQEALVFKSRVLDIGSKYEVLISYVEDGPQKFSVQVQSTAEILSRLMNEINSRPKEPLQEPPLPGSVCLGRYTKDKVLCRAVVMSVMEHKCKLYYVDFGHTEVLPYTDIFQLPPEFINPKVLSIRFTLSGLKELNITQEMKDYFKELVSRKLLVLHVRPPEGPPLIQYGDLYDNGVNVKDILKKVFPAPATVSMAVYPSLQLRRLTKDVQEVVQVSYVESCKNFFVQLDSGTKSLESIMFGLAQYAKSASVFNMTQLKVGLPCAALYDSQWYRAQVLSITGDKVKVVYIDYGNEEVLPIMSLRKIHDDLVTKLPAQAIKCALNGHEVLSPEQEISNHFERLTLEKRFYMTVITSQSNGLLVDLFEFETMRNIYPQLTNNPFCDKTENSTASSQNGEIQQPAKTANLNDVQSEDKYNRKSNVDSWNSTQNARPFQENKSNVWKDEWNQEKQHDNKRERNTYPQRDSSQNDRFIRDDANRFGRDNRSYNKYDRNGTDAFNKGSGKTPRGDRNRFFGSESRYNRNNSADKNWSDKDSDTSSKGNDKRGRNSFNRDNREGRRDSGLSNRTSSTRWNDRNNDRTSYKSGKFNGDYNPSNDQFRDKQNDINNVSYDQANTCEESWDISDTNKKFQEIQISTNKKLQFSSIDITLEMVKNCEVVFINSPLDFFIQINPDNLELESVMNDIAEIYENSGETIQASDIKCDTCCIAQYTEDLKWYRAIIKSVEGSEATVEFIDYGNIELVEFSKIKIIKEEFLKLPMQAVHCKLFGLMNMENKETESLTIFMEKVEGKSLEVEFVTKENGIYEVLLREVIDNISKSNYVNEEFCTSADLMRAKEMANKKVSNIVTKKINTTDYATFDSKWQTALYDPETKHDVIVTWFINPNKFYCQILSKESEFKMMMNEIQKTYAGRESITQTLKVGAVVIARFSEDRALYRAEVVNHDPQKGYIVQYIDFGNCAIMNSNNIYPVEKKFMQLPRLAMQCSLKNIVPISDWSNVDNTALDNCFNADKYECIYHNFNDDQYTVSLIHNGQGVDDMLVQRNLATYATKTSTETVNVTELSNVQDLNDIERVDISLLSGQTIKMRVSSVESTTQFYVQLPSASRCKLVIDNYMATKDTQVMPRLSSHEMCLGAGCLINANGTWRRAVVINCSRSVRFDVKLIDTGAYDEILDGALALPGALAVMQNQALECSLQNIPTLSDADKQLKELIEGKEVLVHVEEVNNNKLIVRLYNLLGNSILSTEDENAKISPICPMPILSSTHEVFLSCAYHSDNMWFMLSSNAEFVTKLSEDLESYYSSSGQRLNQPEVGMLCAAKYVDDKWYRGEIISCTETTACINYIDYGNKEEIILDSIMVLEPQFYEPYQLIVKVSLSVPLAGDSSEQLDVLQAFLLDKTFTAVFYNVHKSWIVDLFEKNGDKLSDKFRSLNLVKKEEEEEKEVAPDEPSLQTSQKVSTTSKFDVCVSHVDSPSQFWLQRTDEIMSLNENQEKLQLEVLTFATIDGIPEEGTLCVAVYSIDNLWYRAEVLDADEDITTVRFIDYGNTDIIDNKADHIRQISDTWRNIKRYAVKCRLDIIPVDTEDWNESTCERFESLVTSVDTVQALIVADSALKRVELFMDGKSVSETLVEEKHAIKINAEQAEPVDEIVDLELDPHSAFVCHINSPDEFWVQEEKSVADLEVMTDRFMVADMFPKIDDIKEGLLCVAKYPEDGQWYRARVLSHDQETTRVIFVDYGNSSSSTEIRVLPEDLRDVPPLSRKCCLELPSHIKEWSERARAEFIDLAADGATIFLLDVLKEQETSLVKLTLCGRNVADILTELCEQRLPVIEERLPPLGEENSPNVMVSHVNNPSEFWIQAESSISELEVMSDRLRDAESFLALNVFDVGTICAARYPEDGYWYRAKILARHEEGTEVLYVDYGNSAFTEELKVLPEDIVNITSLSKRCSLEKPCHVTEWSERACDKFKELAAEGATMFQFEILDENDPTYVRLYLNDTNVVELLLSESENIPKAEVKVEVEGTIASTEEQREIINGTVEDDNEKIHDSSEAIEREESMLNRVNSSNNVACVNETEKLENLIDSEIIDKSFADSDDMEHGYTIEQQEQAENYSEKEGMKLDGNSEVAESESTSEIPVIKASDSDDYMHTTTYLEKSSAVVTELTVDDIVGSMVRDITEETKEETREIDSVNSLDTGENAQLESIARDNEQRESHSPVQSAGIDESLDVLEAERIESKTIEKVSNVDTSSTAIVIRDSELEEVLPVTSESHDIAQIDNISPVEEEGSLCSEEMPRSSMNETSKSETITDVESCLPEERADLFEQTNSRIQSADITEPLGAPISGIERIESKAIEETSDDTSTYAIVTSDLEFQKKVLPITDETRNIDTDDAMEEGRLCSEETPQSSVNETSKSQVSETISDDIVSNLLEKQAILSEQISIKDETESDNDVEVENTFDGANSTDPDTSSESTRTVITARPPSVTKTDDPINEHRAFAPNTRRSRSEDKIVPGCISRGESPTITTTTTTTTRPLTPKTPYSEKLVAGAVNPLLPVADCANESDEILTVSVEDDIPKYAA